jgi:uncharacterized protein (UPF0332 family)
MLDTKRLLRIGQAKSKEQSAWLEGISIERSSGETIERIRIRIVAARFALAREMKKQSRYSPSASAAMQRLTVSRSYYAMYHAIRSAAYIHYAGDDHQQHSDLPQKIPDDFPSYGVWGNQLKSAREYRNQADYDPYPRSRKYWKVMAESVHADAVQLLPIVRNYLRGKGCNV